jgi:hypothetical protein
MGGRCRHCGKGLGRTGGGGRGLCWSHYRDRAIRALYPTLLMGVGCDAPEPTAAELEATVAEQLKALPDWWDEESERERDRERVVRVFELVRCK